MIPVFSKFFGECRNAINWCIKFFSPSTLGIDLGTANTLVYVAGSGVVLNEPSSVAYTSESGINVGYLYGSKAKLMVGKTPMKINVISPLADGVISDFHMTEEMIKKFLSVVVKQNPLLHPVVIAGVPLDSTTVEKRAIQETIERCGAKDVYLVHESMAAAIGANLPVDQPHGCMVVDIGGGTTEISIISLGGIVEGKSIKVGGNKMDKAILDYIKNKYHLLIGETTAEEIKKNIGIAYIKSNHVQRQMLVRGRDLQTQTPEEVTVTEVDIVASLAESIHAILSAIKETLEIAPPELASDVVDRGIVLCGGGAMIRNLDYVISQAFNLPVFIPNEPDLCVIRGIGVIVENYKNYDYVLFKQL